MLLGDIYGNPGPPREINNKAIYIASCLITAMSRLCRPNTIFLTATKNMMIQKKGLHILHFNIISLIPKTIENHFIVKQSKAAIIGLGESKVNSFILNSEVDAEEYHVIRMDR